MRKKDKEELKRLGTELFKRELSKKELIEIIIYAASELKKEAGEKLINLQPNDYDLNLIIKCVPNAKLQEKAAIMLFEIILNSSESLEFKHSKGEYLYRIMKHAAQLRETAWEMFLRQRSEDAGFIVLLEFILEEIPELRNEVEQVLKTILDEVDDIHNQDVIHIIENFPRFRRKAWKKFSSINLKKEYEFVCLWALLENLASIVRNAPTLIEEVKKYVRKNEWIFLKIISKGLERHSNDELQGKIKYILNYRPPKKHRDYSKIKKETLLNLIFKLSK